MKTVYRNDTIFYGVGARTGLALTRCRDEYRGERFVQGRIGLHHICFRARRREDIDAMYAFLQQINAKIVHPPRMDAGHQAITRSYLKILMAFILR